MKKILTLSLIAAASIQAAEPMVPGSMSTDRGGTKSAIDAYSDGGGAYFYDEKGRATYDNSPMNSLVFKYGAAAKESSVSLRDQVKTLSQSTADEKLLADKIPASSASINPPSDGTVCNDFDPKTINDIFTAGVCRGINVEGQACDDNNVQTINDKYISGVCVGTVKYKRSCSEIKSADSGSLTGVYRIDPLQDGNSFDVWCKMDGVGEIVLELKTRQWGNSTGFSTDPISTTFGTLVTGANSKSALDNLTTCNTDSIVNMEWVNGANGSIFTNEQIDALNSVINTGSSGSYAVFDADGDTNWDQIKGCYNNSVVMSADGNEYGKGANNTWVTGYNIDTINKIFTIGIYGGNANQSGYNVSLPRYWQFH